MNAGKQNPPNSIQQTPPALVADRKILTGYFREPFRDVNLLDASIFGESGVARWLRRFRLKEWVGFGIVHPDWYVSMIIQDAKYLASSAFYAFGRRSGKLHEHSCARFDRSVRIATTPWNDSCRIEGQGYFMEFDLRLDERRHRLKLDLEATRTAPAIRGELTLVQDLTRVEPLVVSAPVRPKHNMYTHKTILPVSGELIIDRERLVFDQERDLANLDEHKAYYPYHTTWRWMTFTAFTPNGEIFGANLSDHMMKDEEGLNENCAWFDGKISLLGAVRFRFDLRDPMKPWEIVDTAGRVALRFSPEGYKRESRSFGVVQIDYFQMCGSFTGFLADETGHRHDIENKYGVCEKMDTRF